MNLNKRLAKLEKSLTPKQLVVLWLQEIQPYRNASEYIQFLRSQPESAAPITRLTGQIDQTVRDSLKGQPKEVIADAVRRSVRDVVFLIKLHLQVNLKIMTELRPWRLSQIALSESLGKLHSEFLLRNLIVDIANRVNLESPYPLDPETAAAVDVVVHNHVYTLEAIIDEGHVQEWLWDYLINKGEKELPMDAYDYPAGQATPTIIDEKKIRDCFKDETQFELFRSGQDYRRDLASLTDAEYDAHYETIVNALKELTKSGQVQAGKTVHLETIPIPFLQDVPLVKGQWLNSYLVELAEWGALLQTKGYRTQDEEEAHLLALRHFIRGDGTEVDRVEIQALREKANRSLAKFPGRTLEIEGQMFIHIEDYCAWRSRKVKGDLRKQIKEGLVTSSWNKWVRDNGGDGIATLVGVKVNELHCYIDEYSYYSCPGNIKEHLQKREQLLDSIRLWSFKADRKEGLIKEWKECVGYSLGELYGYKQAITVIQNSYFEGQSVLFPDVAKELTDVITQAETTVNNFNGSFPNSIELYKPVDLEVLLQNACKQSGQIVSYIIDMAKVEALDCMGEEKTARELAERYL